MWMRFAAQGWIFFLAQARVWARGESTSNRAWQSVDETQRLVSSYLQSKADCKAEAVPYGFTKNEVTFCSIRFLRPKNRERIK